MTEGRRETIRGPGLLNSDCLLVINCTAADGYSKTVIEPRTNRDHEREALAAAGRPNEAPTPRQAELSSLGDANRLRNCAARGVSQKSG